MTGEIYRKVHELAAEQFGVFTTAQAVQFDIDHRALAMMCRRGTIERVAHAVYRDPFVPAHRLSSYMTAALWTLSEHAVLSHETVLELLELSDVNPAKIHVTVPRAYRIRRRVPNAYVVHHADLEPNELANFEGIPVTTAARAVRDCHRGHLGLALLRQAIDDGIRFGWIPAREVEALREDVLASVA
jgi:predicted transcriptional regulator of viral defense system